jgi:phosphodiesterase/alkaline phosphatase D-like protein
MTAHAKYTLVLLAIAFLVLPVAAAAQHPQALTITDGPRIEYVGPHSAEIAWTTSTGGSTIIRYGTNPNNLDQVAEAAYDRGQGGHHVTHRVTIKNLKPNTTYYFMVDSGQGQGTGSEAKSPVASFKTKGGVSGESGESAQERQPVRIIDGPRVESAGNNSAVIAWTTNAASSSVVRYGPNPNSLNQTAQAPYADAEGAPQQTHRVRIDNLQPNTTYYFMVDSGQGEGTGTEAKSPVAQFKTK